MTFPTVSVLACVLSLLAMATAAAQVPNSALPGREREQMFGKPGPQRGVPQIELQDGRPRSVFEVKPAKRPATRRKCRGSSRC